MKNDLIIGVDIGGTRTKYGLVNMASGVVVKTLCYRQKEKLGLFFGANQID